MGKKSSSVTSHGLLVLLWSKVAVYSAEAGRPSAVLACGKVELPLGAPYYITVMRPGPSQG